MQGLLVCEMIETRVRRGVSRVERGVFVRVCVYLLINDQYTSRPPRGTCALSIALFSSFRALLQQVVEVWRDDEPLVHLAEPMQVDRIARLARHAHRDHLLIARPNSARLDVE